MGIFLILTVIGLVIGILFWYVAENIYYSFLENLFMCLSIILILLGITCGISSITLIGVKADNKTLFIQKQQEYKVLIQYINSDKSESLLESKNMLNKIENYNNFVINKQVRMERPILKYWVEGANWNELKLIELDNVEK